FAACSTHSRGAAHPNVANLRSLSNRTGFRDFPTCLRASAARLGASAHGFYRCVFSALGGTGIADIRTDSAELKTKARLSREQSHAHAAYRRALVTETDALRHG